MVVALKSLYFSESAKCLNFDNQLVFFQCEFCMHRGEKEYVYSATRVLASHFTSRYLLHRNLQNKVFIQCQQMSYN